ncbi:MAG: family 10 glycosylhydrolase [Promethearchaeota archaeon]
MPKKPILSESQLTLFRERFGNRKIFAQALMPVRGPGGFRKLDYEFAKTLDPEEIIKKCVDNNYNGFGLVVKDTDGALMSNTKVGWNPTGRDLTREFEELCQKYDLIYILSITNMNDAYMGWKSTNGYENNGTVSVHIRNKKKHKAGDPAVHKEGEMRVDLPEGMTIEQLQDDIPFLTNEVDEKVGAARGARGQGYIPKTAFHCPRSEHIDYMISIVKELVSNYKVDGIFADYIRYDGSYTDLCGCERCRTAFSEKYPGKKILKSKEWFDFKEDNIAEYGRRFNEAIKETDPNVVTGWFNLPGPKLFTRNRIAQNFTKLGATMDSVVPMEYPYLTGTADDGRKWRMLANLAHWFFQVSMARRYKEYGDIPILVITNTVECNAEEMLIQCMDYDYGLGISLFKYYGTTDAQWLASKLYGEILKGQEVGDPAPSDEQVKGILREVYKQYPPKNPHLLKWKPDTLRDIPKE